MRYLTLPGIATPLSRIALGTVGFSPDDYQRAAELLDAFIALGGTCIDTAHVYGRGASERALGRWLRERQLPVLCMPEDAAYLAERCLRVQPLNASGPTPFAGGSITPIPCLHGEGWVGRFMAHGHGYFIEKPGEPSLYIAGDTVLSDEVIRCVTQRRPAVSIIPAGGAAMDLGSELIMDATQALDLASRGEGVFIANHLEALDHCPTSRTDLLEQARRRGLDRRVLVPADGQTMTFEEGATTAYR